MVHVAVVISGAFRTLLGCNSSLVAQVFDAHPAWHFSVFAALTVESAMGEAERARARAAVVESYPCVAAVALSPNAEVSAALRRELPALDAVPRGRGTARGKAHNIVKMFRGIAAAHGLLSGPRGTELALPAGCAPRPAKFDLVLRVRPDLCFCEPLRLEPALRSPAWHLPWWSSEARWAFDQLAVGSEAAMADYSNAYAATVRRLVAQGRELYPEAVMWAHLHSVGGEGKMRRLRGFHASLARARAPATPLEPSSLHSPPRLGRSARGALPMRALGGLPATSRPCDGRCPLPAAQERAAPRNLTTPSASCASTSPQSTRLRGGRRRTSARPRSPRRRPDWRALEGGGGTAGGPAGRRTAARSLGGRFAVTQPHKI